jgi:hypothetical protein
MGYLAEQSTDGETLSNTDLERVGIEIRPMDIGGCFIRKVHVTNEGFKQIRCYDRRWKAVSFSKLDLDELFPNEKIARIAVSIRLGKGWVL